MGDSGMLYGRDRLDFDVIRPDRATFTAAHGDDGPYIGAPPEQLRWRASAQPTDIRTCRGRGAV